MSDDRNSSLTPAEWLASNPLAPHAQRLAILFLDAMERRDLEEAGRYVGPGFKMVFPGGSSPARIHDLVEGARSRYQWVAKRLEAVEGYAAEADVVWVRGTLYGVNVHGVAFEKVRFVDRFSVKGEALVTQDVWNDLAELGVLEQR